MQDPLGGTEVRGALAPPCERVLARLRDLSFMTAMLAACQRDEGEGPVLTFCQIKRQFGHRVAAEEHEWSLPVVLVPVLTCHRPGAQCRSRTFCYVLTVGVRVRTVREASQQDEWVARAWLNERAHCCARCQLPDLPHGRGAPGSSRCSIIPLSIRPLF